MSKIIHQQETRETEKQILEYLSCSLQDWANNQDK